ncbi:MAG: beta-galactosidase [bacterium]
MNETTNRVQVRANGLEIGGKVYPLYSGDMHYWRVAPQAWGRALERVVDMGFKFICTYIPWSVHETARGNYDFGSRSHANDIARFLSLCRKKGLFVLVRPGPHINAEITYFGYPKRIFALQEILSRNPDGAPVIIPAPPRMFPAPGYASERFYEEVALYFDALCPILKEHLYPDGPIVGVQADNELSFFFRIQPYDHDYSVASIRLYRQFLQHKYEDVSELNKTYNRKYSSFSDITPPREFAPESVRDLPFQLDWLEYKEYYLIYGINRIAHMLRSRAITGVFYFHNYPTNYPVTPYNVKETEKYIDVQGLDLYCSRRQYHHIKEAALFLSATSRLPFFPEFASGIFPWWQPLFLEDQKLTTPAIFMNGAKAVNFYMIVERERWYGSPVTRRGRIREKYFTFYKDFLRFLHESDFHEYKMVCEAALLSPREYERLQLAASLITPLPYEAAGMPPHWFSHPRAISGLRDRVQTSYQRQRRAFIFGFSQTGIPLSLTDSGIDETALEQYRMVITPSFEFMNLALQKKLIIYALKGGTLVVGPRIPVYDEFFRENSKLSSYMYHPVGTVPEINYNGILLEDADMFDAKPFLEVDGKAIAYVRAMEKGKLIHFGFIFPEYSGIEQSPVLASIMKKLCAACGLKRPYLPDDPLIETRLHIRGNEKILFIANPTKNELSPAITTTDGETFVDVFDQTRFEGRSAVTVPMKPYSVRILKIITELVQI